MSRIILSFIVFLLVAFEGIGQVKDPVKWTATSRKKAGGYEIVLTAIMPKPWHIYSQLTPPGGPVPTKIAFKTNPLVNVNGKAKENGSLKNVHDQYFGVNVKYFDNQVAFVQTVNLKSNVKTNIAGTIEYMVCNDEECLPPKKVPFDLKLQ